MAERKPFTGINDRVRLADVIPLATPFTLNIFPSNICNFRCTYCAQSLGAEYLEREYCFPQELMTMEIIDKVIEQSKAFNTKYKLISFMGHGEPLCNRNLPEMIRKMKKADIANRIDIITNASLLTREYADELIAAGLDVLRVSLQGVSTEAYEKTCGVHLDFEKFVDNLTYFYQNKKQCNVFMKTVDASLAEGEERKFYDIFEKICDRIYIDSIKPVYSGVEYSEAERNLSLDRYGNVHEKRLVCPQPFYMLSVWANGDVTPCDALYKASLLGNVKNERLKDLWNSDIKRKFCKMQLEKKRENDPACQRCCAPDDVASEEDILDMEADRLLRLLI